MDEHFHPTYHGRNITVKDKGAIAVRNCETFDNALVFSKAPCQADKKVSLLFKQTTNRWTGLPRIGFTNQNPDEVDPQLLPAIYTPDALCRMWAEPLKQTTDENMFVEYQFDAMGLVTMKQVGQPETLLDPRRAVDFKKPVWVAVDLSGGYDCVIITNVQALVPQCISKEGESRQQQYLKAMMKGSRRLGHIDLLLIGQSGVGKTSLMKTLIGQRFDPLESSTQGTDTSMACQIDETGSWSGHKNDLDFKKCEVLSAVNSSCADDSSTMFVSLLDFGGDEVFYSTNRMIMPCRPIVVLVFNLGHDLDKPAVIETDGTHRKETVSSDDLTTWEYMDQWMHNVHAYYLAKDWPPIIIVGTHKNCLGKNAAERAWQVSSQFAKLRKALSDTPYEDRIVEQFFAVENSLEDAADSEVKALRRAIEGVGRSVPDMKEEIPLTWLGFELTRLYSPPVVFIAKVKALRRAIEGVGRSVPDVKEEIPLTWLGFELTRLYSPPVVSVAKDTIQRYMTGMIENEAGMMLNYYTWTGRFLVMPLKDENVFVIDRFWLVDAIRRITTCLEPKEQVSGLSKSWHRLTDEGILEDRFLDYLWRDLLVNRGEQDLDVSDAKQCLLRNMYIWDLLCERCPINEKMNRNYQKPGAVQGGGQPTAEEETHFMPCAVQKRQVTKHTPPVLASSHVFYIAFDHFVPEFVFHRLVVRTLRWSQKQQGVELEPRLGYRQAAFSVDSDHDVEIEMSPLKKAYIKVCIKRLAIVSFGGSSEAKQAQPDPSPCVMCKVKDFLRDTVNDMFWAPTIRFTLSVPCPCDPEGTLHFLPLSECLEKGGVRCQRTPSLRIDTRRVQEMFCSPEDSPIRQLDPYVMSEKHLLAIASKLGPEWEQLGAHLDFEQSNIFKFKQDSSTTDNAIFSMLVAWSQREGGDRRSKVKMLSEALDSCKRRDVVDELLTHTCR